MFTVSRDIDIDMSHMQPDSHQFDDMKGGQDDYHDPSSRIPRAGSRRSSNRVVDAMCDAGTQMTIKPNRRSSGHRELPSPSPPPKSRGNRFTPSPKSRISPQARRRFSNSPKIHQNAARPRGMPKGGSPSIRQRKVSSSVPSHLAPSKLMKHAEVTLRKASRALSSIDATDDELRWLMKQVSDLVQRAPRTKAPMQARSVPAPARGRRFDELPVSKLQELDRDLAILSQKYEKANDEDLVDVLSTKNRALDKELDALSKSNRKNASDIARRDRALTKGVSGGGVLSGRHHPIHGVEPDLDQKREDLRRLKDKHSSLSMSIESHGHQLEELERRHAVLSVQAQDMSKELKNSVTHLPVKDESPIDYEEFELKDKFTKYSTMLDKLQQQRQRLARRYSLTKSRVVEEVNGIQHQISNDEQQLDAVLTQLNSIQLQIGRLQSMTNMNLPPGAIVPEVTIKSNAQVELEAAAEGIDNANADATKAEAEEVPTVEEEAPAPSHRSHVPPASTHRSQLTQPESSRSSQPSNIDELIFSARHASVEVEEKPLEHIRTPVAGDDMRAAIDALRQRKGYQSRPVTGAQHSEVYSSCFEDYEQSRPCSGMPPDTPMGLNSSMHKSLGTSFQPIKEVPSREASRKSGAEAAAPVSIDLALAAAVASKPEPQSATPPHVVTQPPPVFKAIPMLPALASTPKPQHAPIMSFGLIPKVKPELVKPEPVATLPQSNLTTVSQPISAFPSSLPTKLHVAAPIQVEKSPIQISPPVIQQDEKIQNVMQQFTPPKQSIDLPGLGSDDFVQNENSLNKSGFFNKHGLDHLATPLSVEKTGSPMATGLVKTPVADAPVLAETSPAQALGASGISSIALGGTLNGRPGELSMAPAPVDDKPKRRSRARHVEEVASKPRWGADFLADI